MGKLITIHTICYLYLEEMMTRLCANISLLKDHPLFKNLKNNF